MTVHVPSVDAPPARPTKLAKVTSGDGRYGRADMPDPAPTKLGSLSILAGRGEFVEIPLLGRAWMQLVPHRNRNEIEGAVRHELEAHQIRIEPSATGHRLAFDAEIAVQTLARAVRDPDDPTHKTPFGTLAEWADLDEDVITAAWHVYNDTRYRLNPLDSIQLSEADLEGIRFAIQKKSAPLLRCFGVARLSLYLLTTESLPASSTTSPSSSGPESPASTPE